MSIKNEMLHTTRHDLEQKTEHLGSTILLKNGIMII